jgi:hypothetical protein
VAQHGHLLLRHVHRFMFNVVLALAQADEELANARAEISAQQEQLSHLGMTLFCLSYSNDVSFEATHMLRTRRGCDL